MSDAARPLDEAYDLIERGEADAARNLLDEIRTDYADDPDYWWVYAHATDDPDEGRTALEKVRELQPSYPGLSNLSQQIEIDTSPTVEEVEQPSVSDGTADLPSDDDFDEFDDFASELETARQTESQNRRGWLLGIAAIIVIGVIIGILAFSGGDDDPTATEVAQTDTTPVPTAVNVGESTAEVTAESTAAVVSQEATEVVDDEEATETVTTEATETVTGDDGDEEETPEATEATEAVDDADDEETAEATDTSEATDDYSALTAEMSDFDVPDGGIQAQDTTLDTTLVVTTCSPPGPASSNAIVGIIDVFATQIDTLDEEINAIGIAITDCETDTVRRLVGIERETLDAYAADDITIQDIQRQLRPLN